MIPAPLRLFHPTAAARVAVVSAVPAYGGQEGFMVRVVRGGDLGGRAFGPFPEDDLPARFEAVADDLRAEGYGPPGLPALLSAHKPDVVVLELGANDGLRGLPVEAASSNLREMIAMSHAGTNAS